jgi:hypothetical protein
MDINFIVTCHNREDYLPYLEEVFKSYKKIIPHHFICYNGDKSYFPCDLRIKNLGFQRGENSLIKLGYEVSKHYNDYPRFVKIGIDTFMLNEDVIISIFKQLEEKQLPYAGQWECRPGITLTSDIFFCDTRFGNVFETLEAKDDKEIMERKMEKAVRKIGKGWLPIERELSTERDTGLGVVKSHDIGYNLEAFKNFKTTIFKIKEEMPFIEKLSFIEKLKKNWYYTKEIWKN